MNNETLIMKLRELLVLLMQSRSLAEKSADAIRYCREQMVEKTLPVNIYGEYREIIEHLSELAEENNHIAPDDLLRSGGDLLLSILLLSERLAGDVAVNQYLNQNGVHYF